MSDQEREMHLHLLKQCEWLLYEMHSGGITAGRWNDEKLRILRDSISAVLTYHNLLANPYEAVRGE